MIQTQTRKPKTTRVVRVILQKKKTRDGRFCSWEGKEDLEKKLKELARKVVIADAKAEKATKSLGWSTVGAICQSIRDPSISTIPEVAEAASLFRQLRDLQHQLIWDYNFDGNFVVKEVTIILDSQNQQRHETLFESNGVYD